MDFFKDKIVFPEMLKLLFLSFAWLGNSGMCVLVGGGRAVNRKHHPAERCDLRFGSKRTENFSKRTEKFEITRGAADVCTKSSSIHNNKQVLVTPCHLRNKIVKQIVAWWKSIVQHLCVCVEHSRMLDIYVFDTNVCRMENCPLLLFKHDTLC